MPYLSLIVPTMRVGGLDILFDSLAKSTFTDFELVLVDGLYEQRRELVQREAANRFLCVRHVGLTPNPFPNAAFCAYANAGVLASTGEVLVFAVDYSRVPKDLLAVHAAFHLGDETRRRGLMLPHRYFGLVRSAAFPAYQGEEVDRYEADVRSGLLDRFLFTLAPEGDDVRVDPPGGHKADQGAVVDAEADPKLRLPDGPVRQDFFHAKNESVRKQHVLSIDGWDTDLDGTHLYQDSDFADRLSIKAGVQWLLRSGPVMEICNPRHVFPLARRARDSKDNYRIWQGKKQAGYPTPKRSIIDIEVREEQRMAPETIGRGMRLVMVYGQFSSAIHGPFDIAKLDRAGLTGSESSFFNLVRGLSERGHDVAVLCDCAGPADYHGAKVFPIQAIEKLKQMEGVHAVIAWNEPDYLEAAPAGAQRICDQQLNDFGYCRNPNWRGLVDQWVSPSANHAKNVMAGLANVAVIPNSVDLELFRPEVPKPGKRVVWCSSPDRGLHRLLSLWPEVRKRVPDAELHVFYRLAPWIQRAVSSPDQVQARRARYIAASLARMIGHGVVARDLVSNAVMALELRAASVLAYPCDPVRYTEGFGVSVLDACAAGCQPIISGADALPEVHGEAAVVIPTLDEQPWVDAIAGLLNGAPRKTNEMKRHAERHRYREVARVWDELLQRRVQWTSQRSEAKTPPTVAASASP